MEKMIDSSQMEDFSIALVSAIVSVAGFSCNSPTRDNDSIDMEVLTNKLKMRSRIDLQLKCCSTLTLNSASISYWLPIKNYNDLRIQLACPRYLIIVRVPKEIDSWMRLSEEEMVIKHAAYWCSISGYKEVLNLNKKKKEKKVLIKIPRTQIFDPKTLIKMMLKNNSFMNEIIEHCDYKNNVLEGYE